MKPKILFLLHLPPPMHGAAMVGQFIKESTKINDAFNCKFINLSTSKNLNEISKFGFRKVYSIIELQTKVFVALLTNKYDLCYLTLSSAGPGFYKDSIIVLIAKLFRKKVVLHFHNKGVSKNSKNWVNKTLYKCVFNSVYVILLSKYLICDIDKYVNNSNIFICPNGIPITYKILEKKNKKENNVVCKLLFLSNMIREKGVMDLLDACNMLKKAGAKFECHFVGDWMSISNEEFDRSIVKLNLEDCVFAHGKKVGKQKVDFLLAADIFAFPTYNDCFPICLLEALEFGLPIVTTYEGGIREIVINECNGFTIEQRDIQALFEKLYNLINDQEKRIEMGKASRNIFESNFTIQKFETRFITVINDILNKG